MTDNHYDEYLTELKGVIDALSRDKFHEIIDLLIDAWERERQIFVIGNGGSASTASHFACDINKGVSLGLEKRFKMICLNDNIPTMLAYANDLSYDDVFVEQLKNFITPDDLVVGFSGSGNSTNVLKAVDYANGIGARTIGITGFQGGELGQLASTALVVPSNDMQKIEDLHMIIVHMIMQIACKRTAA
jgi:D-sedoheptulose 7-phosphate isomerase